MMDSRIPMRWVGGIGTLGFGTLLTLAGPSIAADSSYLQKSG